MYFRSGADNQALFALHPFLYFLCACTGKPVISYGSYEDHVDCDCCEQWNSAVKHDGAYGTAAYGLTPNGFGEYRPFINSRESTLSSEFNARMPKLGAYRSSAKFPVAHADSVNPTIRADINLNVPIGFILTSPAQRAPVTTNINEV